MNDAAGSPEATISGTPGAPQGRSPPYGKRFGQAKHEDRDAFVKDLLKDPRRRDAEDPLASGFSKLSTALGRKLANPCLIGEARPGHESGKRNESRRSLPRERIDIRNVPRAVKAVLSK